MSNDETPEEAPAEELSPLSRAIALPPSLATACDFILNGIISGWSDLGKELSSETESVRNAWLPILAQVLKTDVRTVMTRAELSPEVDDDEATWKPFPVELLPEPLQSYVRQAAPATGSDESMVALQLLSLLASCIGTTRRIQLKRGWSESCALWCIVVSRSGQKKTPPFLEVTGLLGSHAKRASSDFSAAMTTYKRAVEAQRSNKREAHTDPPEAPVERRYIIRDATREAMLMRLRDNPRGLLLARDELTAWFKSFGAYKAGLGGDAESWLEMYSGSPQDVDRKGGSIEDRHVHIDRALVSITGGIQPTTLKRTISEEAIDNGMLARFMLAWPPERVGRWTDAELDPQCRKAVVDVVDWLLALHHGEEGPVDMQLDAEAKAVWVEHVNAIQDRIASTGANSLRAALSKIEGVAARLALIIHLCRCGAWENVDHNTIDVESITAGIKIAWWMADESARVYGEMGWVDDPAKGMEDRLLRLLRNAPAGLTVTEIHRLTGNNYKGADLRKALARLASKGKARSAKDKPAGTLKPTERWSALAESRQT
jgi:hypothetical protein